MKPTYYDFLIHSNIKKIFFYCYLILSGMEGKGWEGEKREERVRKEISPNSKCTYYVFLTKGAMDEKRSNSKIKYFAD